MMIVDQPESPNTKIEIIDEIKRIVSVLSTQFSDIMRNIQWYSTIVIAEIAGIAKLTSVSHNWILALYIISIIFLFLSIGALVYSNIRAQDMKIKIESLLTKMISEVLDSTINEPTSQSEAKDIKVTIGQLYGIAENSEPQIFSKIGLASFLFGSVFGGLGIVFS